MEATDLQLITSTKIFSSKSARTLIVDLRPFPLNLNAMTRRSPAGS
jgi:hypothetical protein